MLTWYLVDRMDNCTSSFGNSDGNVNVPIANWNGSEWNRNGNYVENGWDDNERVVLLDNIVVYKKKTLFTVFSF